MRTAALAALLVAACGGGSSTPGADVQAVVNPAGQVPDSTPGCPQLPTEPVKDLPGASGVVLTVLNDGEEPRQALRYRPKAGTRAPMTMKLDLDISMSEMMIHIVSPRTVMRAITDVISVDDKEIVQRMVFEEAYTEPREGVMDEVRAATDKELQGMTCDVGLMSFDAVGNIIGVRVIGDGKLATSMEQLDGLSNPLPVVPVGVGASWQLTEHVVRNGVQMDRTVTYDLVGFDGDVVNLRAQIEISAPPQTFFQNGTTAELHGMTGFGTMDASLDLTTMIPSSRGDTELTMNMSAGGTDLSMQMKMKVLVEQE